MDGPVYKLEHIVHNRGNIEDFEGPLDVILYLLSKNKIEIQDIPIALILEQYLAYLELRQQMDLEVASEFVTMAAQLMFIKTRMLLSLEDAEAQSEMEQLVKALEERRSSESYAKIKFITARFGQMSEYGRSILTKPPEPMERGKVYKYSHKPEELLTAWREITDRSDRRTPPPLSNFSEIVRQEPYPVESKAKDIMSLLRRGISSFRLLFRGNRSRSEIVATFLAVLELCKARVITLTGSESDCTVTATGESMEGLQL